MLLMPVSEAPQPAHAHLDALAETATTLLGQASALIQGLSETQLLWQPAPEKWSIAHCLDHLVVTNRLYFGQIEEALAEAPTAERAGLQYQPSLFGRLFIYASGPRSRMRIRAFRMFQPPEEAHPDAPERFRTQQATLVALIDRARDFDMQAVKVRSPVSPLLSLRLGEALEMLLAHEQRHLDQASRVRAAAGFPDA
jgi:hypothetical protein